MKKKFKLELKKRKKEKHFSEKTKSKNSITPNLTSIIISLSITRPYSSVNLSTPAFPQITPFILNHLPSKVQTQES